MKRFITIIPAELQQEANEYCSNFVDGGEFTFTVKLSPSGEEPVTHYLSNWNMTKTEEFIMKQKYETYMTEVEEMTDAVVIEQLGLQKIIPNDDFISKITGE
jgi:hypothetical protein